MTSTLTLESESSLAAGKNRGKKGRWHGWQDRNLNPLLWSCVCQLELLLLVPPDSSIACPSFPQLLLNSALGLMGLEI